MEKYKDYMMEKLDEFTNKLCAEIMKKENVTSGDIYPNQAFDLDMHCESIVNILLEVVEQNKEDYDEDEE